MKAVIKNFFRSKGVARFRMGQFLNGLYLKNGTQFTLYITVLNWQRYITNNGMYFIEAPKKVTKHFRTELQHGVIISFNSPVSYPVQNMHIGVKVRKAVFKKLLHNKHRSIA